jgi:hypothetical protein
LPLAVTDPGLKLELASDGKPATLNMTLPANPFLADTVMVEVADDPRTTVIESGIALSEKSGAGNTLSESGIE